MKKNKQNGKSSNKATCKPASLITGQFIRSGVIRLLNPSTFEEVFEMKPEQRYLDQAINMLNKFSDNQILGKWLFIANHDDNAGLDQIEKRFFALVDLAWTCYSVKFYMDHPKELEELRQKAESSKKRIKTRLL